MARPGGELAEAERPEFPPHGRLAHRDPELLPEPLDQVDQPPADHPVAPRLRARLDDPRQGGALLRRERRRFARRLAVEEPVRTLRVEAQDPVPHDLEPDPANPGRLRPASAIADLGQRQEAPDLFRVSALPCQSSQFTTGKVASKLDRRGHGNPNLFSMMNHAGRARGSLRESRSPRLGIRQTIHVAWR